MSAGLTMTRTFYKGVWVMNIRLKELIIKRARQENKGLDIDGDIIVIFDKKYYVNIINDEVWEAK
jgi:outer membrane receptor for Fe3+-dicitrate